MEKKISNSDNLPHFVSPYSRTKVAPEIPLIRPPVEAYSIIVPVTSGCSWNHCRFCGIYKGVQDYSIISINKVQKIVEHYSKYYPDAPKIYLAGGNPTSAPTEHLIKILNIIKDSFNKVKQISCYAKVLDILQKTERELEELANAGLSIVYMGMESGNDNVLKFMKKGHTGKTLIKAVHKLHEASIKVSLYIILGLGGKKWTEQHAIDTAHVLNEAKPDIFRFRTLNVLENAPLAEDIINGTFEMLTPYELVLEELRIIEEISADLHAEMKSDHISNYVNIETNDIGNEKDLFIKELKKILEDPKIKKWIPKRLEHM